MEQIIVAGSMPNGRQLSILSVAKAAIPLCGHIRSRLLCAHFSRSRPILGISRAAVPQVAPLTLLRGRKIHHRAERLTA
jgi:hypothetical protein